MFQQLELFHDEPFSLRLKMDEAMRIFWENYWKDLPSAVTTRSHKKRILVFFRNRFIDTISKHDIEAFRKSMKSAQYSDPTINKAHMFLSRMFSKLQEYKEAGQINGIDFKSIQLPHKNPCTQVPKVNERIYQRKQIITPQLFKRLMGNSDDDMMETLRMLVLTGLRPGDLHSITANNIDLKRMMIELVQGKTVTTSNPSGVVLRKPINQEVADILLKRLKNCKPGSPLFPSKNWQKRWDALRKAANCMHIQRRDIRRSFAVYMIDNGVDAQTTAEALGHTSLRLLPAYTPRTIEHLKKANEVIEKIF